MFLPLVVSLLIASSFAVEVEGPERNDVFSSSSEDIKLTYEPAEPFKEMEVTTEKENVVELSAEAPQEVEAPQEPEEEQQKPTEASAEGLTELDGSPQAFRAMRGSITELKETKTYNEFDVSCPITKYNVKGIIWTRCRHGKTVTAGCIAPNGEKIKFGETYVDGRARYICLEQGEEVILMPVECIFKNKEYSVGSVFVVKHFFYQCVQKPNGIAVEPLGCESPTGDMVNIGEEFRKGHFIFRCDQDQNGKVFEVGVKCYIPSLGAVIAIGERYAYDGYYYECQRKGKRSIKTEVVGCADPKQQFVEPKKRYVKGSAVYECQNDGGEMKHTVVGCYAKDHRTGVLSQYEFGDKFYESYKQGYGYVMECTLEDGVVRHKPVECVRHGSQHDYYLDVGCASLLEDRLFVCQQVTKRSVMIRLMTLPKNKTVEEFMAACGLKQCETRATYAVEE